VKETKRKYLNHNRLLKLNYSICRINIKADWINQKHRFKSTSTRI